MKTSRNLAIAGAVGLLLAWATWTWGTPPQQGRQARAAIVEMPQGQRDQLKRRYQEYQNLSASQRAAILELHRAVIGDPELAESLSAYTRFVTGLDPWEREALENESDPEKRLAQVAELIHVSDDRDGDMRRPGWMTGEMVRGPFYRSDDFQEILSRLVEMLPGSHVVEGDKESVEWQLRAFKRIAVMWRGDEYGDWPPPRATDEFLAMIPNEWVRKMLKHHRKDERFAYQKRRKLLAAVLARTLMAQWQRAVFHRIPREELQSAVVSLQRKEHRDRPWRDGGRFQAAIMKNLESKPGDIGEFARRYGEVRKLYLKIDPWADGHDRNRRRPPPGDGHRDGHRRPDDRHFGDRDGSPHEGPREPGPPRRSDR